MPWIVVYSSVYICLSKLHTKQQTRTTWLDTYRYYFMHTSILLFMFIFYLRGFQYNVHYSISSWYLLFALWCVVCMCLNLPPPPPPPPNISPTLSLISLCSLTLSLSHSRNLIGSCHFMIHVRRVSSSHKHWLIKITWYANLTTWGGPSPLRSLLLLKVMACSRGGEF